jgi:CBS domain-containing protein
VRLRDLLDERRVVVPLETESVREATIRLAQALVATSAVSDEDRFAEMLKSDWPEDIVSVAGRAFLPHFRTDAVRTVALALGVTPEPIARASDPGRTARVVALIVAPLREASEYLRTMGSLARALGSDEVLAGLHAARSAADVLAIEPFGETPVPADVTVRDVMTPNAVAVRSDTTLAEAAALMLRRRIGTLPVTGEAGEVVGLLTDGHLLRHLLPQTVQQLSTGQVRAVRRRPVKGAPTDPRRLPVSDVMEKSVLCLDEDQTIADIAALMLAKDVDRFPVTRDGALVGFLTRGDIVRKLLGT